MLAGRARTVTGDEGEGPSSAATTGARDVVVIGLKGEDVKVAAGEVREREGGEVDEEIMEVEEGVASKAEGAIEAREVVERARVWTADESWEVVEGSDAIDDVTGPRTTDEPPTKLDETTSLKTAGTVVARVALAASKSHTGGIETAAKPPKQRPLSGSQTKATSACVEKFPIWIRICDESRFFLRRCDGGTRRQDIV